MEIILTQEKLDDIYSNEIALDELSPKDQRLTIGKLSTIATLEKLYKHEIELDSKRKRNICNCGNVLTFNAGSTVSGDEQILRLVNADFCKNRIICTLCNLLSVSKQRKNYIKILPIIKQYFPTSRYLFLTFSTKNCRPRYLNSRIKKLNYMFAQFRKHKQYQQFGAIGYLKSVEVTVNHEDGTVHPHLHIILHLENSDYFKSGRYVTQSELLITFKQIGKLNYLPSVDIRAIPVDEDPKRTAEYLFKYVIKPHEFNANPPMMMSIDAQLKGVRLVSSGGSLKQWSKLDDEDINDLGISDEEIAKEGTHIFVFNTVKQNHLLYQPWGSTDDEAVNNRTNPAVAVNSE